MDQVKTVLLADFKTANEARKEKLAKKYGYEDADAYYFYLTGEVRTKRKNNPTVATDSALEEGESALDMVIAFDTTGSMGSYIGAVRRHIVGLVENLFKNSPDLRIKIVTFGDYCDMRSPQDFGIAYQSIELTNNANDLVNFVNKNHQTGGGDADEFYELVLQKVLTETDWREGAKRSMLLIGDCAPHKTSYSHPNLKGSTPDWRVEAERYAKAGIQVDTLMIRPNMMDSKWYEELSSTTNGVCLPFDKSENTGVVLESLAYARSSKKSFTAMKETVTFAATATNDTALEGAYKKMETIL